MLFISQRFCAIVPERGEWDREELRWGGAVKAIQSEKCSGVENRLRWMALRCEAAVRISLS